MRTALLVLTLVALTAVAVAPVASADPLGGEPPLGDPQCMPVYRDYDFGPARVQSPNSCTYHVWVLGHQII